MQWTGDGVVSGPPCDGCWYHNPERYARWLQAGVFQGIFRTHMAAPGDPTPWKYSVSHAKPNA